MSQALQSMAKVILTANIAAPTSDRVRRVAIDSHTTLSSHVEAALLMYLPTVEKDNQTT
jgi:hypothetical protein